MSSRYQQGFILKNARVYRHFSYFSVLSVAFNTACCESIAIFFEQMIAAKRLG
jgi:hypothetical protein